MATKGLASQFCHRIAGAEPVAENAFRASRAGKDSVYWGSVEKAGGESGRWLCPFARQAGSAGTRYFPLATAWSVNALAASMDEVLMRFEELQDNRNESLVFAVAELKEVIEAQAGQIRDIADDVHVERLFQEARRSDAEDVQASIDILQIQNRNTTAYIEAADAQLALEVAAFDALRQAQTVADDQRMTALEIQIEGFLEEFGAGCAQRIADNQISANPHRQMKHQVQSRSCGRDFDALSFQCCTTASADGAGSPGSATVCLRSDESPCLRAAASVQDDCDPFHVDVARIAQGASDT